MEDTDRPSDGITSLLQQWKKGEPEAFNQLYTQVYDYLRRLAGNKMRNERADHTLQPTALVNEVWIKLAQRRNIDFENRGHFLAIATIVMREILAEHARGKNAQKRDGKLDRVSLNDKNLGNDSTEWTLIDLNDAISKFEKLDPRRSNVLKLRFLAGCTTEEIAGILGLADTTVKRDWTVAKAWLVNELSSK